MKGIFYKGKIEKNFVGHIMAEIYKDRVYDPFLMGKKDLTILDVGANIGITANYFSQFGKVYAMEPSEQHFECLDKMVKFNKLNVVPIKKALYIKDGKLPFGGPDDNDTMKSLHAAVWKDRKPSEIVDCISLDTLFKEYKIKHIDFMKLDIEGSEVEVISGKGFKEVADKIDTIVTEIHSWSGRNPNQLIDTLKMRGFHTETLKADANIIVARR